MSTSTVTPGRSVADLHPELAAQWHPTRNGDLTAQQVSAGSRRKVWWTCPVDAAHEWDAVVSNRTRGRGCPTCARARRCDRAPRCDNDLATTHPELVAQWHPTRNGDLTPQQVSAGSCRKVWWSNCPIDATHEWEARVSNRAAGSGCPMCAGQKIQVGNNDLATTHPEIAAQWHPTRNPKLTPHQVTSGSSRRVWWRCPVDAAHEWCAQVDGRVRFGFGCPTCAGHRLVVGVNDLATTHPDLAAQWHPTLNGDLTPQQVRHGSWVSAWWTCPVDGEHVWRARLNRRSSPTRPTNCPACARIRSLRAFGVHAI